MIAFAPVSSRTTFDGKTIADNYIIFDKAMGADIATFAILCAFEDNARLLYVGVLSDVSGSDIG